MHVSSRKKESLQGMMFVLFLTFCFQSLKWCKWQAGIETVWIHAYKQPIWRRQQNTLLRWIIWIKFQTQKIHDAGSWQCYGYIHMYIYIRLYFWIVCWNVDTLRATNRTPDSADMFGSLGGRADATRVLKAFGRCLQSMGEGTVSWQLWRLRFGVGWVGDSRIGRLMAGESNPVWA